jgi:hypothetical protein
LALAETGSTAAGGYKDASATLKKNAMSVAEHRVLLGGPASTSHVQRFLAGHGIGRGAQ